MVALQTLFSGGPGAYVSLPRGSALVLNGQQLRFSHFRFTWIWVLGSSAGSATCWLPELGQVIECS